MRIRTIPFHLIIFLLLSGLTMPAIACPPPYCGSCCHWVSTGPGPSDGYCDLDTGADCGDCCGCGSCYSCVSCSCEYDCPNSDDICCTDSGSYCCESGETCCQGTCCESGECCDSGTCVTPDTTWETSGSWSLEAPDGILDEINGAINNIPNVEISLTSASVTAAKKQRDCCKDDGTFIANGERKAEATVSAEASVTVSVWGGSLEYEFGTETWGASIEITAELRVEGAITVNVTAGYRWDDCKEEECPFGSFSGTPSVALVAEVSAQACGTFWGVSFCLDIGITAGIHSDWSFDLTLNEPDCDDGSQGSGSLDKLYLKFTGSANGDSDSKKYYIVGSE